MNWAMWSCSSYAKQFQKCNAQNAFFIGIKELSIALVDISWLKANPAKVFTNGDWTLSQSRTTSSRRDDLVVFGMAKLSHKKKHFVAHNEIQQIVMRNSKLAGLRRSASRWISWHRKTTPTAHPLRSS